MALITGDYVSGIDSSLIDLILVGEVDKKFLDQLVEKSEAIIKRKIRTLVLNHDEFERLKPKLENDKALPIWGSMV